MQKVLTVFIQLMSAAFDDGYSLNQRLERKAIVDVALTS
jgi:hypothetical protein